MYRVTEYLGDYPLESQLHWNAEFESFIRAYTVGKDIWLESLATTKVLDPDYYVLIEREDSNDPADFRPVGAFNISGAGVFDYINTTKIKKFIKRFVMSG